MTNNFIPYGRQFIDDEDIKSVLSILKSDYLTQGPNIEVFEKQLSKRVNAKYGVAVNSATSALHVACMALGLEVGDYLWTTPITFVASANCAIYCGANVDFVEVNMDSGLIDIEAFKCKLVKAEKNGKLPKIVVPVHLAGTSCDMKSIKELSKKYGFYILEDASHAVGGTYYDNPVGSCRYSDICVFSFHPVKIITTGEGGIATTNNYLLDQKMRLFRSHGIEKNKIKFENEISGPWAYEQQMLGYNYRMSEISAALGISQLKKLDNFIKLRSINYQKYVELLKELPISMNLIPDKVCSSHHLSFLKLNKPNKNLHKNLFVTLKEMGIGVQVHYIPVHLQPFYRKKGFKIGDFPNSEIFANNIISLPNFPSLKDTEHNFVVDCLKKAFQTCTF